MYISIAAMTWRFFLLFPICLNFFMLHSIPLLLPTTYIKLLIFQKAYRVYWDPCYTPGIVFGYHNADDQGPTVFLLALEQIAFYN